LAFASDTPASRIRQGRSFFPFIMSKYRCRYRLEVERTK
jgi:hypothetical protein